MKFGTSKFGLACIGFAAFVLLLALLGIVVSAPAFSLIALVCGIACIAVTYANMRAINSKNRS